MRTHLAALGVLATAFTAHAEVSYPDKMCTKGFSQPAYLLSVGGNYELHVGRKVELLETAGSVALGMNGLQLMSKGGSKMEVLYSTEIEMFSSGMTGDEENNEITPLLIFRDRVFWPCE